MLISKLKSNQQIQAETNEQVAKKNQIMLKHLIDIHNGKFVSKISHSFDSLEGFSPYKTEISR